MKGSFVVCCLIDFNENHSIVAKVDFRKLNSVFHEGRATGGMGDLGGGGGDRILHGVRETMLPQSSVQIHA